ncbi:MAG: TVP38/TMEM64 family protein [Candidatus Lokiarchaeota archaeon]|nr:TVP38/TMEM64 family protein [Candidatus Lokiarchaeota archaeon]
MIFFIAIVVLMAALYIYQFLIDETFLPRVVLYYVVIPLRYLMIWGVFVFFGIMILQAIIAPIPSEMILLASGLIWTFFGGIIVGYIGSLISAVIGFYIAYKGGRPLAINALGEQTVDSMEYYMSKYGVLLVGGMRAIPMVPYDLFTLASGFTQMDFKKYLAATAIGTIPRVIFYSWAGTILSSGIDQYISLLQSDPLAASNWFNTFSLNFNIFLLILVIVVIGGFLIFYFVVFPHMRKSYEKIQQENKE